MASITKIGTGKQPPRAIDYINDMNGGKRERIRLGIVALTFAEEAKRRIERLLMARTLNQSIDAETAAWLNGISDLLHERLARKSLCPQRVKPADSPQLAHWCEKYLTERQADLKPGSIVRLRHTASRLVTCFGEKMPIGDIAPTDAFDWRAQMLASGLSEATVRLHCRNAKSIFNAAVERELSPRNPFAKLRSAAIAANRDRYITTTETNSLLDVAPLPWRVLIGLARLAGLRVPSESHGLTWGDVDWSQRRLKVYAPKTNSTRFVPIVPELLAILETAFESAPDGATAIVTVPRNNRHRMLTQLLQRAGIVPWDDLFQAMRRSADTDFARQHPQHAVSTWIGHSVAVSQKHYLQTRRSLPHRRPHATAARSSNHPHGAARGRKGQNLGK